MRVNKTFICKLLQGGIFFLCFYHTGVCVCMQMVCVSFPTASWHCMKEQPGYSDNSFSTRAGSFEEEG